MLTDEDVAPKAGLLRECRAAFDWWQRLASGRAGVALMFGWALAEATVWPIIPDFLLAPMAAANRRRFYLPLAASILGAAVGGVLLFLFAAHAPDGAYRVLRHVPMVHESQIAAADRELVARGAAGYFVQPWSGIPFKVWAVVGGALGLSPWRAIPAFILGRGLRMTLWATLARLLASRFPRFVRDFSLFLAAIYAVVFFYGWWQVTG
jgi:1-acyl-sn-glycerol-3-phosphate acyltransferase